MSELSIEQRLRRGVERAGGVCLKGENVAGFPDRIILAPFNRACFVELKTPEGRVTGIQNRWIRALRTLGFRVEVLRSAEEVDAFVEDFLG